MNTTIKYTNKKDKRKGKRKLKVTDARKKKNKKTFAAKRNARKKERKKERYENYMKSIDTKSRIKNVECDGGREEKMEKKRPSS